MTASTLMVQGTTSSAGKSLLVTALCRYFRQEGLRVAPFKSQNMALNSAVTPDGSEIGRAQAAQAEAAGVLPTADMNPILLKPEGDRRSQVVVMGRPIGSLSALEYHAHKPELRSVIAESLARLRKCHDLVVIEGAGSPAEINLKDRDLVNMHVAQLANAPVLLVGDIDRGGVFAAFVGTLELLEPHERDRIAGFVVNKFRGDLALLSPGLDFLAQRTGKPVVRVLPYLRELRLPDEDSLSLADRPARASACAGQVDVAVVRLPRISNHDDVEPLEHEPGVVVRFVEEPSELVSADLVILPGSKSTVADLDWLRQRGFAAGLAARAHAGRPILGICGGCQMLGRSIRDPHRAESDRERVEGLSLLPIDTVFARDKVTADVEVRSAAPSFLTDHRPLDSSLRAYEIHMGQIEPISRAAAPFEILTRNGRPAAAPDGAMSDDGAVVGTLLHGLFLDDGLRARLVGLLRRQKGLPALPGRAPVDARQSTYDRLADSVREHLDCALLRRLAMP